MPLKCKVLREHTCYLLHRFNLDARHIDVPLLKHRVDDVDRSAIEPGIGGTFGLTLMIGALRSMHCATLNRLQFLNGALRRSLESGAPFLRAARLVQGKRRPGDCVELVEGNAGIERVFADAFDESWRLSMLTEVSCPISA